MADLTITPSAVKTGSKGNVITAATPIIQGEMVSLDTAGKAIKANCTDIELAKFEGIALNSAETSQPLSVLKSGKIELGVGSTVQGETYYLSATDGKIMPSADLVSTNFVSVIGVAYDVSSINITPIITGITKA